MIAAVKRLPAGQPIKRASQNRVAPYVTSTGIQIGVFYEPPAKNQMDELEEFWQCVLLDVEPEWSERRVAIYTAYAVFIALVLFLATQEW